MFYCLQAALPGAVQLVKVVGGFAVLRCQGLYEVQLSLRERPYPDQVEEARQQAAAEAAKQVQQQAVEASEPAGTSAAAEAAANQKPEPAQPPAAAESEVAPQTRWCWTLQYAVLLPNAAQRPPLRPEQMGPFMFHLSRRMETAADAAAVEAARRQGRQQVIGESEGAGKAASQSQQQTGPTSSGRTSQPSVSGVSAAVSSASGLSGVSTAEKIDAGRGLHLREYAADENMLPLMIMHGVLRDVAAQVLLNESTAAAKQLAAAGSKWDGHLKLSKAEVLTPGVRMHYWQQVPVLMAAQPAALAASSDSAASFPALELGVGSDGTVQVVHLPPLRLPGSLHQVTLQLDSHTVDIEGLLLQAVAVTASMHLQLLQKTVAQVFRQKGLGQFVQLRLCEFGTECEPAVGTGSAPSDAKSAAVPGAGAVVASAPHSAAVPVAMPGSLVVVLNGNALVSVSIQPWSGRIILRPGSVYGSNRNMEMGIQLHQVCGRASLHTTCVWQMRGLDIVTVMRYLCYRPSL